MKALILFSHGSLLCGSGEALERHAGRLRAAGEWDVVEVGYLNYSVPIFAEAVVKCREAGARDIVVQPFFLVPGYFVSKSLPEAVDAVRADFPDLTFTIASAIGYDERLADAIVESAQNPLGPGHWRDDLSAAARNCRANRECPLYGTPNCPRAPEPGSPVRPFVE
jgi:sirohydrochlorin cobaltochelatase